MKKYFKFIAMAAIGMFAFTSCENVPMPYAQPTISSIEQQEAKIVPLGDGSLSNPFNVKGINKFIEDGSFSSTTYYYIKGIVTSFKSGEEPGASSYGNATYYIADVKGGFTTFYVYRGYGLNGAKFTSSTDLLVGDTVVIKALVTNYSGTYETQTGKSQIVSINSSSKGGGDTPSTSGTKDAPLTVAQAKAGSGNAYVKGDIVGYIDGLSLADGAKFEVATESQSELLLADAADCTDYTVCIPVQLSSGTAVRTALDPNQSAVIGKQVIVYGSLETYFGTTGVKSTSWARMNGTDYGTDPESVTPAADPTGTGTAADPWNVSAALKYIKTLSSSDAPTTLYYTKGKISTVVKMGTSGSIQFKMSDDGTASNELMVYFCDSLNKNKFTNLTDLKAGDEVIVCGNVKNYSGNTPEYNSGAYLVYLNGKTASGSVTPDPTPDPDPTPSGSNILSNGDFETWGSTSLPTNWDGVAGNATLAQSSDAHSGSYSVNVSAYESSNKRLAYKEISLEAGTYVLTFYAKATTDELCQARPGYAPISGGKASTYTYGDFAKLNNTTWTLVTYQFNLTATTSICPIVLNCKTSAGYAVAQNILVDDVSLVKK